eukprot:452591-Prymnesium_polylepis.1
MARRLPPPASSRWRMNAERAALSSAPRSECRLGISCGTRATNQTARAGRWDGVRMQDYIADRPHDDRGRVPVAQHHRRHVALPPLVEELVVVVAVLARVPAVEGLLHEQHAEPVASVDKCARDRVVRRADRVVAIGLQQLDPPLLGAADRLGAERAVVVVHAPTMQLEAAAVEHEAFRCVEREGADPKRRHLLIDRRLLLDGGGRRERHGRAIERRLVGAPSLH